VLLIGVTWGQRKYAQVMLLKASCKQMGWMCVCVYACACKRARVFVRVRSCACGHPSPWMHVFCLQNTSAILLHENACLFVICDVSTGNFLCRKGSDITMTRKEHHEVKNHCNTAEPELCPSIRYGFNMFKLCCWLVCSHISNPTHKSRTNV